jgi:hypothetical protein
VTIITDAEFYGFRSAIISFMIDMTLRPLSRAMRWASSTIPEACLSSSTRVGKGRFFFWYCQLKNRMASRFFFCVLKTFIRTHRPPPCRAYGSGLRVLEHKFQSVGKRYTPSRSVLLTLEFKCVYPEFTSFCSWQINNINFSNSNLGFCPVDLRRKSV